MNFLIADDHVLVRLGLREILADAFPDAFFFEAGNGEEVLTQLTRSEFAVLLLDINMPGRNGLEVLADVKRNYARLPVIMISVNPVEQYAPRCLSAGAAAYISKDKAPEDLARTTMDILGIDSSVQMLHAV
jgi:two-component system, NarL family, invasion response regulator UvrY